jgi:hypothetical protein
MTNHCVNCGMFIDSKCGCPEGREPVPDCNVSPDDRAALTDFQTFAINRAISVFEDVMGDILNWEDDSLSVAVAGAITDLRSALSPSQPQPVNRGVPNKLSVREKASNSNNLVWPEGYCLDPNGKMSCPDGAYPHWSFGYDMGYAEALALRTNVIKDALAQIRSASVPVNRADGDAVPVAIYQVLSQAHSMTASWEDVPKEFYDRQHPVQRRMVYLAPPAKPIGYVTSYALENVLAHGGHIPMHPEPISLATVPVYLAAPLASTSADAPVDDADLASFEVLLDAYAASVAVNDVFNIKTMAKTIRATAEARDNVLAFANKLQRAPIAANAQAHVALGEMVGWCYEHGGKTRFVDRGDTYSDSIVFKMRPVYYAAPIASALPAFAMPELPDLPPQDHYANNMALWNEVSLRKFAFAYADRVVVASALPAQGSRDPKNQRLFEFLDTAAGGGYVFSGVDASDLFNEFFPEEYSAAPALPAAPIVTDQDLTMDVDELAEFERTVAEFEDASETSTDYDQLMDWARRGLLECTHFEVTKSGNDILAAAPIALALPAAQPREKS